MKVALVHDYLNEFGGAERVLLALSEIWPEAPIYTAFCRKDSAAAKRFEGKKIIESFASKIPFFSSKLHSPLRFMAPVIWESFDFDEFGVVISSSSWYITKGILTRPETLHISYIHTPPRYLYGYKTAVEWQKYWPVRLYATLVNKGLREYDFLTAQRVDVMIANSQEVRGRIKKYWRRDSEIIFPPVDTRVQGTGYRVKGEGEYFLAGGRLVGSKHFDLIIKAANALKIPLKVYGSGPLMSMLKEMAGRTVEMLGYVDDDQLLDLYKDAKAYVALAEDEDFGITPVEAMAAGTPVLAYKGGGYLETVTDKTGVFVDELSVDGVKKGIEKIQDSRFKIQDLWEQAEKFSKERFMREMRDLVTREYGKLQKQNEI